MNINNFFNFIGEKRPQYRMSSDNGELLNTLKQSFENGVKTGTYGETEKLMAIPVPEKGFIDEKGKQGLFIQTVGYSNSVRTADYYNFYYQTTYNNYKDNELDGLQTIMDRFNPDVLQVTIEYSNGLKNGAYTKYRGGKVDEVTHYVDDDKKRVDEYYKNGNIAHTYYYRKMYMDNRRVDRPDDSKPREFYDPEGNPIDKETYFDLQHNMYRLDR